MTKKGVEQKHSETAKDADAVLNFVSQCLHHETVILFDYIISTSAENSDYYGVKKFFQTMKKQHTGEKLLFAIEEGTIGSFLEQRGLKMIENLDNEEIEETLYIIIRKTIPPHLPLSV